MIRPDAPSLRLNAFIKNDGEKSWTRYHESSAIPLGIMISSVGTAQQAADNQGAAGGVQPTEEMLTDPTPPSQEIISYLLKINLIKSPCILCRAQK